LRNSEKGHAISIAALFLWAGGKAGCTIENGAVGRKRKRKSLSGCRYPDIMDENLCYGWAGLACLRRQRGKSKNGKAVRSRES